MNHSEHKINTQNNKNKFKENFNQISYELLEGFCGSIVTEEDIKQAMEIIYTKIIELTKHSLFSDPSLEVILEGISILESNP
jgi:hypothetical protein